MISLSCAAAAIVVAVLQPIGALGDAKPCGLEGDEDVALALVVHDHKDGHGRRGYDATHDLSGGEGRAREHDGKGEDGTRLFDPGVCGLVLRDALRDDVCVRAEREEGGGLVEIVPWKEMELELEAGAMRRGPNDGGALLDDVAEMSDHVVLLWGCALGSLRCVAGCRMLWPACCWFRGK